MICDCQDLRRFVLPRPRRFLHPHQRSRRPLRDDNRRRGERLSDVDASEDVDDLKQ